MDIGSGDDSEENTDDGDLYCGFAPEVKERVKEYLRAEAYIATVLSHDSEHQNASLTLQKQFTDLETELKERIERSERDKRIINDKFNQQIRDIEAKRGRALEAEHESFIPELEYLQQVIEDRGFKIGRQQNVLKRVQTERVKGKENKRAMRLAGGFELGLAVAETRKRTEQMGRGSF
jgi:predicted GIY-YIG superfamily endonuclease